MNIGIPWPTQSAAVARICRGRCHLIQVLPGAKCRPTHPTANGCARPPLGHSRCLHLHLQRSAQSCLAEPHDGQPEAQQPQRVTSANPLEQLRETTDTKRRSELLRELDHTWSEWEERYAPTPAEQYLAEELGVGKSAVMLAAVQNPGLASLDVSSQVLPALRALLSAGLPPQDTWFLAARRWRLLEDPASLSRWLDFLLVYGMQPRDVQNFLLRASPDLLAHTTLFQAGSVVSFLRRMGLQHDVLASRVLPVWPGLLGRDVHSQLQPVVSFLMALGLEAAAVGRLVAAWPEVLMQDVEGQLAPWLEYLRGLGCSTVQVCEVLSLCPHLLGFKPGEVFGGVLAALEGVGIGREDVRQMVSVSVAFLIAPSASAGVQAAVECLLQHGFSTEQVRSMCLSRPEILAPKPHDLGRTLRFVYDTVGGDNATVLSCPLLLTRPLGQCLGPRFSFIQKRGLGHKYVGADGSTFEFYRLLVADEEQWCASLGLSVNEYQGFKLVWDEEYSLRLHQEAASEFQEELQKLGAYEGGSRSS